MSTSPRHPLQNFTQYKSAGWKKDLDHILGSFFHYSYPSFNEGEWKKLKTRFSEYLGQHQEWKAIKEEKPLQYMPYMESCFKTLTGIKLEGLSQFTGWIKPDNYYHGVVAKKGQLHMCLHLARTEQPKGLQIHPSQSCSATQKEEETPPTGLHTPHKEGGATQGACFDSHAPMKTGGVGDGQSWAEQTEASGSEEWVTRPKTHHQSGSKRWERQSTNPFLLQAKEGVRQHSSFTVMQVNSHQPIIMWLPRGWAASTLIWSLAQ